MEENQNASGIVISDAYFSSTQLSRRQARDEA
jgi:hypothetical protein